MAMCDYYLCDVCGQKCFYDANIAEYDDQNRYLLSGSAVGIAAICETCAKTHDCVVVPKGNPLAVLAAEFVRYWTTDRTPDGCGMCGGIPHSTTCYVGRMATLVGKRDEVSMEHAVGVKSEAP